MPIQLSGELDSSSALSPQVYQLLHQGIVRSEIRPGERLSDIELARALGISRQPIREAFMRLQQDDLLDVRPQRGTFVKRISVPAVLDGRFVREAIEADIVQLVAHAPEKAVIYELKSLLNAQRKVRKKRPEEFMQLDDAFHQLLADAAGKSTAWRIIEGIKTQMDRVRFLSFNHFHTEKLIRQHTDIVTAIENQRVASAVEHMRLHLRGILESIHLIKAEFPDFFTRENEVFPGLTIDSKRQ